MMHSRSAMDPFAALRLSFLTLMGRLSKKKTAIRNRWREHFSDQLNRTNSVNPEVLNDLPLLPPIQSLDEPPTLGEVTVAIAGLKNNKTAGPDGIPGEVYKYGGRPLLFRIHAFVLSCWSAGRVPQQWRDANIVTIYKRKGARQDCGNYRGISLLATAGKILAKIMLGRLSASVIGILLPESQSGFRSGRSTSDSIFVARQLIEKSREHRVPLNFAFIDIVKAFDTVNRPLLWSLLTRLGCPPTFVSVLKSLHDNMQARIIVDGDVTEPFTLCAGVKQGCVLAPLLFNTYIAAATLLARSQLSAEDADVVRYRTDGSLFNLSRLKAKSKTNEALIYDLQYADDAALVAPSASALQKGLTAISIAYSDCGLEINTRKTVAMSIGEDQSPQFIVGDSELSSVDNFCYLGSILSTSATLDAEIQARLRHASAAFGRLRSRVYNNRDFKIKTRAAVYSSVVLSVLLYGAETWIIYRRQIRTLEGFHIRCIRSILGVSWRNRIPHEEFKNFVGWATDFCMSVGPV